MHSVFQQLLFRVIAALFVVGFAVSCSSTDSDAPATKKPKSMSSGLKDPVSTPYTSMSRMEYPFDSAGNYLGANALQWERVNGRKYSSDSRKYSRKKKKSYSSSSRSKSKSKPKKTTKAKPKPKVTKRYYTVQTGDTLWAISRKYSCSVSTIKSLSGLKSDSIRPGQRLRVK